MEFPAAAHNPLDIATRFPHSCGLGSRPLWTSGDPNSHESPFPPLSRWPFLISELENARARCLSEGRQRARGASIEPLYDGTIDGETAGRERRSTRRRNQAVLDESQNLELFTQLAPVSIINCSLSPLVQLSIPSRRVIQGEGRYST
jgi:hypothetical protein